MWRMTVVRNDRWQLSKNKTCHLSFFQRILISKVTAVKIDRFLEKWQMPCVNFDICHFWNQNPLKISGVRKTSLLLLNISLSSFFSQQQLAHMAHSGCSAPFVSSPCSLSFSTSPKRKARPWKISNARWWDAFDEWAQWQISSLCHSTCNL